jgi:hypothetical protein
MEFFNQAVTRKFNVEMPLGQVLYSTVVTFCAEYQKWGEGAVNESAFRFALSDHYRSNELIPIVAILGFSLK